MHINHIYHRVDKTLAGVLGRQAAPVQSQVLLDIEAGRARQDALDAAYRPHSIPHVYVNDFGRTVGPVGTPIPQPPRGTYPPGWTDVHSDEYAQDD